MRKKKGLVVVLVAQRLSGVEDVSDTDIRANAVDVDGVVKSKWASGDVVSVDGVYTARVGVCPDAEVAVDKAVVHVEEHVARRAVDVLHDGSDSVVAKGVRATFGAEGHTSKVGVGVALVDIFGIAVGGQAAVAVAGKAMGLVIGARANIEVQVGELLQGGISQAVARG